MDESSLWIIKLDENDQKKDNIWYSGQKFKLITYKENQ